MYVQKHGVCRLTTLASIDAQLSRYVRVYVLYMKNKTTCHVCRKKITCRCSLLAVGKELMCVCMWERAHVRVYVGKSSCACVCAVHEE